MKNNKFTINHIYLDEEEGEPGVCIVGKSPDHYIPMVILNNFLGGEYLKLRGSGIGIHLFLPKKYAQIWSHKIGTVDDLWDLSDENNEILLLDKLKKNKEKFICEECFTALIAHSNNYEQDEIDFLFAETFLAICERCKQEKECIEKEI